MSLLVSAILWEIFKRHSRSPVEPCRAAQISWATQNKSRSNPMANMSSDLANIVNVEINFNNTGNERNRPHAGDNEENNNELGKDIEWVSFHRARWEIKAYRRIAAVASILRVIPTMNDAVEKGGERSKKGDKF